MIDRDKKSKVACIECSDYDQLMVENALWNALEFLGGLDKIVKKGNKVHIKPNLLTAKTPDKGATTHPTIVKAVVKKVMELGAAVTIGDSPAGMSKPIEIYWQKTGMQEIADETGAELVKLEKNRIVHKEIDGRSYYIAQVIAEADVVINIAKLKTHGLMLYTGVIKNMFGSIPGFRKSEYHKQAPKTKDFAKILVDIFSITAPVLNILDAIEVMEGNGPSAGNVRKLGLIFASQDAVAVDSLAAQVLGFEEDEIETTKLAFERGLGQKNIENIVLSSSIIENYKNQNFVLPSNHFQHYVPNSIVKLLGKLIWVRPFPDKALCKRCGACITICPTKAMVSQDGFPVIDYKKCISCFCCDETCPHNAIVQKMSWIAKKLQ